MMVKAIRHLRASWAGHHRKAIGMHLIIALGLVIGAIVLAVYLDS